MKSATGISLVRSELLCYATNHVKNSTVESLANCLTEFYDPEEIHAARQLLWMQGEKLLPKLPRRPHPPTDKASARVFAEDIAHWTSVLSDTDKPLEVEFYALDLRRIPPCTPEEINLFSIVARVATLEKKFETAAAIASQESLYPPSDQETLLKRVDIDPPVNSEPSRASTSTASGKSAPWITVPKNSSKSSARKRVRVAAKKLPSVVGTRTGTELKGCGPIKQLFMYGVDNLCTDADLKEYMCKSKVVPKEVRRVSKETWLRASFKVTVSADDIGKTSEGNFWPEGVMCREWLRNPPKPPPTLPNDARNDDNVFASDHDCHD